MSSNAATQYSTRSILQWPLMDWPYRVRQLVTRTTLLSRDVCPRKFQIAGAHLFKSHLLYNQIEWNKKNPIRTNKNNTHTWAHMYTHTRTHTNVRIWGSNPPVVNIIIIYIECRNMVPSVLAPLKKIRIPCSKGSFPFFSKTNCSAVAPFLFE